jgi:hypothetical protein
MEMDLELVKAGPSLELHWEDDEPDWSTEGWHRHFDFVAVHQVVLPNYSFVVRWIRILVHSNDFVGVVVVVAAP